ncbi:MAG: ATP-binding protein [Bacillota bacterium]
MKDSVSEIKVLSLEEAVNIIEELMQQNKILSEQNELLIKENRKLKKTITSQKDPLKENKKNKISEDQKKLLETMLKILPVGVFIIGEDGSVKDANDEAKKIWGGIKLIGPDKYKQYKAWDYNTGEELPLERRAAYKAVVKGESTYQEPVKIETFDGNIKVIFNSSTPIFDEDHKFKGAVIVNQDITEFTRISEELKKSEERFRTLASASFEGIAITENGIIKEANEQFAKMHGYELPEVIGMHVNQFQHPDQKDFLVDLMKSGDEYIGEFRNIRKDGTEIILETHGRSIELFGKKFRITTLRDITESKIAELKLKNTLADLERSNKELEQFAYVASHDLQEPLRMVSNFARLISKEYYGRLDDKADHYIEFMIDGTKRMQNLISDLLMYARVTTKAQPLVPTDMNQIMEYISADLKMSIDEKKAYISCEKLPNVNADPVQVRQLLQNLVSNAIKFRGNEDPEVYIKAEKLPDEWLFSIRDNGIGIKPEFHERVFVIFQRLHEREKYSGTGIGLAICKKIVERHGGRIWVESEEGKGSTFYFTLPM